MSITTEEYALSGCSVKCTAGSSSPKFEGTSQAIVKVNGKLVLTEMDTVIIPFGTCKTLTAAAGGISMPCIPALIPMTWQDTSRPETVNGLKILLKTSKIPCVVGGEVSISG